MKKFCLRFTAFLLALVLIAGGVSAAETTQLNILWAGVGERAVTVVYRLTDPQENQQLTCLVYDGSGESLLWVGQFPAQAGVDALFVPVDERENGYQVHLGGDGVRTPRKITVDRQTGYTAPGLPYVPGATAGQVLESLDGLSDPALYRDASPLETEQPVLPGDVLTASHTDAGSLALWTVIYGDVNLDGKINAADALQVLRYAVGKATFTDVALAAADWVQNGQISAATALTILQFSVGKIAVF